MKSSRFAIDLRVKQLRFFFYFLEGMHIAKQNNTQKVYFIE